MIQSRGKLTSMVREMPGTPGARLFKVVSTMVDNRRERPEYHQMMYQGMADENLSQELRDAISEQRRAVNEIVRGLIVEGQATGEVAGDDPDQLVTAVMACLDGLSRRVLTMPHGESGEKLPPPGIILRMLRPDVGRVSLG